MKNITNYDEDITPKIQRAIDKFILSRVRSLPPPHNFPNLSDGRIIAAYRQRNSDAYHNLAVLITKELNK